ncbi:MULTISPECIES: bifunctional DNA-formamidopyrimidine glycosylase/DNA-(apurinic or apyrimidinic site) lyase [unclassified Microbacterium]|uniref:bifunctional DNA-formamidopyrimidine glycosylase/DNA-(apurinic or apyrimidinic site) lyase n=1 Tax=unclassified Microbacterium TaxID=2609290 RepID=UPI001656BD97|nr:MULTISPECIES: bifunctional DNA-formamidopyrimidine glycosylase/DNA-(apurinic or apyrimidinic site) lyase [unclassified Microbacterium]CAD5139004.1 Formamidopyrimidine-DNA glycosylase [Microbacterium sp. Nx66]
MPELPEVEVVRSGLAPAAVDAVITGVSVFDERALTRHTAGAADFVQRLEGRRFTAAARRGKFLWLPLDSDDSALIAHLGMSGQMLLRAPDAPSERHERIRLSIEHPRHGELAIVFADQRTFGSLAVDALVPDGPSRIPTQVAHIARDPLDPFFDDAVFRAALARRHSAIKRVLLDQGVVSGIGNIYADESLWAARIHPETPADALPTRAVNRLLAEVRSVLQKALAEGGTSFDAQYVNVNGQAGYFAHSLNAYGRGGKPCPRCGTPITRAAFMNRSSHFCPRCQRRR